MVELQAWRTVAVDCVGCGAKPLEPHADTCRRQVHCRDCGTAEGERHAPACPSARCEQTGLYLQQCPCSDPRLGPEEWHGPDRYQGVDAMERDCRTLGWFIRWNADAARWERARPDEADAGPDITRLTEQARWDREGGRWVKHRAAVYYRHAEQGPLTPDEIGLIEKMRLWADRLGMDVVFEFSDHVSRIGNGLKNVKRAITAPAHLRCTAVLVPDQNVFGASSKVRRKQIVALRDAAPGVMIMSYSTWDGDAVEPSSYLEQGRQEALAVMGPRQQEEVPGDVVA